MNGNEIWIWVGIGLTPYHIKRSCETKGIQTLEIRASFWSLIVQRRKRRREWAVRIPLIERLRDAVWAAILRLRESRSAPEKEEEAQPE